MSATLINSVGRSALQLHIVFSPAPTHSVGSNRIWQNPQNTTTTGHKNNQPKKIKIILQFPTLLYPFQPFFAQSQSSAPVTSYLLPSALLPHHAVTPSRYAHDHSPQGMMIR